MLEWLNDSRKRRAPTRTCSAPDISKFISNGAQLMTVAMLTELGFDEQSVNLIEGQLKSGEWSNSKHRSINGMDGYEIWIQKHKLWIKPANYAEVQSWGIHPGGVTARDQYFCERPHLLDKMPKGMPKQEM